MVKLLLILACAQLTALGQGFTFTDVAWLGRYPVATPVIPPSTCTSNSTFIPDIGVGQPYPMRIYVTNTEPITNITFTVTDLLHNSTLDLSVVLAKCGTTNSYGVMFSSIGTGSEASTLTFTVSDDIPGFDYPPFQFAVAVTNGTYNAVNRIGLGTDMALCSPDVKDISTITEGFGEFLGLSPNGYWSVYVVDTIAVDGGSIGCFTLTINGSPNYPLAP